MAKSTEKLLNKKVLVVGGSSGIGYGAAKILLDHGALVSIVSSSEEKVQSAVERLAKDNDNGNTAQGAVGDVRDESAFTELLKSQGPFDHVVFSGVDKIIRGNIADADLNDAKHLFGVKFWGAVVVGKAAAKHDIINRGGSLTLTSGAAALKPGKGAAIGGALNGGVTSLTQGLANDLAHKGIRVNTVVPGFVKTELWDKLGQTKEQQQQTFKSAAARLPVGFVANPEDIAEAYLYAVRADYACGSLIVIDGGSLL